MMARIVEEKELERLEARLRPHRLRRQALAAVTGLAAGLLVWFVGTLWVSLPAEPASPDARARARAPPYQLPGRQGQYGAVPCHSA